MCALGMKCTSKIVLILFTFNKLTTFTVIGQTKMNLLGLIK